MPDRDPQLLRVPPRPAAAVGQPLEVPVLEPELLREDVDGAHGGPLEGFHPVRQQVGFRGGGAPLGGLPEDVGVEG